MPAPKFTNEERVARASEAARLLANPIFREVFDGKRQALFEQWAASTMEQAERREAAYQLCKCIAALEKDFKAVVEDGQVAQSDIDEAQKKADAEKARQTRKR